MEFSDVINSRASKRTYSNKDVEDEKIKYILECARWAPSWGNRQCWQFIVIKNKEIIKSLIKASILNFWLKNVPVIIVACGNPKLSGNRNNIQYYIVDVAIAMEHLILAATDVGLGSCWIGDFNEKKVKEVLGIPEKIKVVALSPLGYPAKKKSLTSIFFRLFSGSSKRKSLNEIVHNEKW